MSLRLALIILYFLVMNSKRCNIYIYIYIYFSLRMFLFGLICRLRRENIQTGLLTFKMKEHEEQVN